MSDLFPGTQERRVSLGDVEIFARIGGSGQPLLLIHGFPQSHAMWHPIAPALMENFTIIMPDLRGYGNSSCPPNGPGNVPYSKRVMAADLVGLMRELGHEQFLVCGHDRGARVAYRMALDHPDRVTRLAVLDIVPTHAMWTNFSVKLGMKAYHWLFLAQPEPLPEMLIGRAAIEWVDYTIASWTKARDLSAFDPRALDEYRAAFRRPEHVHAMCNDYRAGQTVDLENDIADREAGRRIACPTLAVWGDAGFPGETGTPLDIWRDWCVDVSGRGIDSGHFVVEENPSAALDLLLPFLTDRQT
jgi:haloacetate dehalogenase